MPTFLKDYLSTWPASQTKFNPRNHAEFSFVCGGGYGPAVSYLFIYLFFAVLVSVLSYNLFEPDRKQGGKL